MAKHAQQHSVIAQEDPWRWVTFSSFWGGVYYLLVSAGIIAGSRSPNVRINRRATLVSLLVYMATFVSGGTLFSFLEQRIVRRSAKEQSERVIASGTLEPSIPFQALGSAAGSIVPLGLVLAANEIARRATGETVFAPTAVDWRRAVVVTGTLSGLAGLAVSRIATWVAEDAQDAARDFPEEPQL